MTINYICIINIYVIINYITKWAITLNTKHHYCLNVKMLNYYTIYIHINKLISEIIIAWNKNDIQNYNCGKL